MSAIASPPRPKPLPDVPPEWRLRPNFTRPLSLFNPLDYLKLLYWVFFKPQFIREYVKWLDPKAAEARGRRVVVGAVLGSAKIRRFAIQFLLLEIFFPFLICYFSQQFDVSVDWRFFLVGLAVSAGASTLILGDGIAVRTIAGISGNLSFAPIFAWTTALIIDKTFRINEIVVVAFGIILIGITTGILRIATYGASGVMERGVYKGAANAIGFGRFIFIPFGYLLPTRSAIIYDGLALTSFPHIKKELYTILTSDLAKGISVFDEILDYSLQFIPVINAVNEFVLVNDIKTHNLVRLIFQINRPELVQFISRDLGKTINRDGWGIKKPLPYRTDTPSRAICAAYSQVLDASTDKFEETSKALHFAVDTFSQNPALGYAEESRWCYALLAQLWDGSQLEQIAGIKQKPLKVNYDEALRPEVVYSINDLLDTVRDARTIRDATSDVERLRAQGRANDRLRRLREYVGDVCFEPEKKILLVVIDNWTREFTERGGELGREQVITVIPNNYVVGPALRNQHSHLFVGRQDIYTEIMRWWSNEQVKPPVLVWGQRRIGKTSILLHLAQNLSEEYIPVFIDLQSVGAVNSLDGLFYNLTRVISRELEPRGIKVTAPGSAEFRREPIIRFDRFLDELTARIPAGKWLVLMLDEFEKIEEKIELLPPDLMTYFRNMMQHRPSIAMILAGSHQLDEMSRDFWNPLMGIAKLVHVDYLEDESAGRLITNPWADFPLNYEPRAVKFILQQCGGHPLLLQAVGYEIVERVNQRLARGQGQVSPLATVADARSAVDAVLRTSEYFRAVHISLSPSARKLLVSIADEQESAGQTITIPSKPGKAFKELLRRDVIQVRGNQAHIRVELLRRWLRARK